MRHPYSTNSEERKHIPFYLAVLAVVGSIPVLGWIISLLAALFGLGALAIAATTRPPAGQAVARAAA